MLSISNVIQRLHPKAQQPVSLSEYLLKDPDYRDISADEIARDLGYFTQVQRGFGFPYHPYKPKDGDSGRKAISEMEALKRMLAGKPIELQPMRKIAVNLSPSQLESIASLTSPVAAVAKSAAFAANANLGVQTLTRENKNGGAIPIPSPAHLKLLYQLQSMDFPDKPAGEISAAAKNLSYFTAKAKLTDHPWTFHSPKRQIFGVLKDAAKSFLKQGCKGAVAGAAVGALLGGPLGALFGVHFGGIVSMVLWGAGIGFGSGSAVGAKGPLFSPNGEEYDEITALAHVLKKDPLNFQQEEVHTFNVPFLGNFGWTSEYGKPSLIADSGELATFSKMESTTVPPCDKDTSQSA